jgi:hypothetical protein
MLRRSFSSLKIKINNIMVSSIYKLLFLSLLSYCSSFSIAKLSRYHTKLEQSRDYGIGSKKGPPSVAEAVKAVETIIPQKVVDKVAPLEVVAPVVAAVESLDTRSVEDIIIQQAESQARGVMERQVQLDLLQAQLSKSIAKKLEVEDVISREISVLRLKIEDIEAAETAAQASLKEVLLSLRKAAESKNELITDSKGVVAQLKEVRSKITESSILVLLESSIAQKQALVDVERYIFPLILRFVTFPLMPIHVHT